MKTFLKIVVGIIVIVVFAWLINIGIEKSDRVTCANLKVEQTQYSLWYATPSEREMCTALGMDLPADNTSWPDGFDPILNHSEI